MQAHTLFTRDSVFTQSYFSSHPTSCNLTHHLPETVSSLNHISHHTQRHAISHTVYHRQCLHSIIFLITPNIMQAHTLFTRDSAFTQSYFSSHPTSCKLTHCLPETVPSLNHISHHAQRHTISHTVYQRQCLHSIIFLITPNIMQAHKLFTRDSAFTQSYFSSHLTSCKLTHCLPETVPSLNHISHHTQCHASSHTVYQRQCLHSTIFLITPNVMQPHTLFTRDSAFTQSYFSSHPMSCNLTHCLPETVPSLSHISHHTQRHATSHTVYQRQCLHSIIFLITPNIMQAHTLFTRDSAFTQSYFSSHPTSCNLTHRLPETVPSLNHISHHTQRHAISHTVYQRQCLHSVTFLITPNVMQAHTPFTRDSAFTQSYFSSHPTSCKLTHCLSETVPSLNHISHHTQRHAISHTVYQRQCLHSVTFLITSNVMQAHTLFTRDSAFTQSYFSSHPTSCNLTHRLPETVPSLNHISHHAQRHASSHTVYQRQCLHSIIFLITPNVMQAHTLFTRDSAFTQSYFSSHPTSCKLTHCLPETVPSLNHISHHT